MNKSHPRFAAESRDIRYDPPPNLVLIPKYCNLLSRKSLHIYLPATKHDVLILLLSMKQ